MTSNDIPLTTFERRLKAGIIVGATAAFASPMYGAIVVGLYALTAVTLTAMVCPRTWGLRLLGHAMVLALYLLLDKHICSWAGYLPPVVFVFLCALQFYCTRPSGRWRSGTDLLIARIVVKGASQQNTAHRISWLVYTHEDLNEDQLRAIKRKFCGGCPEPRFQQGWPGVDICLRSVQVWYSQEEERLLQRVSEWCAPHWHQPVEFEYRATPLQRVDQFFSDFFGTTSLFVVLLVALFVEKDIVREWGLMKTKIKIFMTAFYAVCTLLGVPMAVSFEGTFDWCLTSSITSLTNRLESMRRFICSAWSSTKGTVKTGVRRAKAAANWVRSCFTWAGKTATKAVQTVANGTSQALNWMCPRVAWTFGVVVHVAKGFAAGLGKLRPVALWCLRMTVKIVEVATILVIALALSVMATHVTLQLIEWLGGLVSSIGAFLLGLWDVVSSSALTCWRGISVATGAAAVGTARASAVAWEILGVVVVCSWRLALVAGAIGVAAAVGRALVLTIRAARDRCCCLVASGYKKRTLLRKARGAGDGCNRPKLASLDSEKLEHASASALVAAAWRDVVLLDGGAQPQAKRGKIDLAEVRKVARRLYAEQLARQGAASFGSATNEGAVPPVARRVRWKSSKAAVAGTAKASPPTLRRSLRTRPGAGRSPGDTLGE